MRKRLRCRGRSILFWLLLSLSGFLVYSYIFPLNIDVRSGSFHHQRMCPACFGENLCPDLHAGRITLTNWTRRTVSKVFNAKNVFLAELRLQGEASAEKAVLKKLGHDAELQLLDRNICTVSGQRPDHCHPAHYIKFLTESFTLHRANEKTLDYKEIGRYDWTEVLACMRSQRLVDLLVRRAHYHPAAPTVANLLTMLMINPEPIVFMAFPKEEGWPFPKYHGGCGRLVAFENAGRSLADYYSAPWDVRVSLARQLLEMALKFTRNDDGVALYLTDWTADNFAVDEDGRVALVDGENFVLVDQKVSGIPYEKVEGFNYKERARVKALNETGAPGWNVAHTSDGFGCRTSFCYSSEDLCTHHESDHNLYGVCKVSQRV